MFALPGYQIVQQVQAGTKNVIYRGIRESDRTSVIIKTLLAEFPSLEDITYLRHEYKITQQLQLEGVVRTYSLENAGNSYALIMEDLGGTSLKQLLAAKKPTLREFLSIAIQLATALAELHQHHIIHKDIKPSNIIINASTKQLKLIDFSIATRLSRETATFNNPNLLEGTLAYISPEQTGRMNRTLDYRTDFYSLGITCYEMLTGQLPFTTLDPMELVYSHIAKDPTPIEQLNPEVPRVISAIVMKLIAKNAEDRYQSAQGLKVDLEECLNQLQATGRITKFTPGEKDKSGQFLIPQKLYGRELEVNTLLNAFERVGAGLAERLSNPTTQEQNLPLQGKSELILVSGYSGIGKTSVVQEIHKPIVRQRGYFIAGKFDQFKRNIPYAAIIQAFQELIRQLLTETAEEIAVWKSQLLEALGANGQVIIDVIPEIELIIGQQPEVPQLDSTASQNRFTLAFKKFISVFTKKSHPLVLFLDDLQWADLASLKLIQLLISDLDSHYLLIVGAYRDNEVSPTHPLILTLEEIQKTGAFINNIVLQPLSLNTVSQIVTDTLQDADIKRSQELSRLLFNKTQGNPFFFTQLLQTLYAERLLQFDFNQGRWLWNLEEIQALGITDYNVVELVARNLQKLPEATQKALKLAACIGNQFYLDVLAIVSEQSQFATADNLWEALQSGLLLPLSKEYKIPLLLDPSEQDKTPIEEFRVGYKFLHDRVQQAAYSLIPENQRQETHLKIGRLLLQQTKSYALEETIFDIVNQLNIGREFIDQPSEREELTHLNLKAGKKAKAATAYETAVKYLTTGLELLPENSWHSHYELTLNLHVEAAEAEYLNTNIERADILVELVLRQAKNLLDKVKVYELRILFYVAQYQLDRALALGLSVMEMLGVTLSPFPNNENVIVPLPELRNLATIPVMTDVNKLAVMRLFVNVVAAAMMTAPTTYVQLTLTMIGLCLEYGHTAEAAYVYANYGLILCGAEHFDAGYHAGQIAVAILDQFQASSVKCKVYAVFNAFIRHYKEPAKETILSLQEAVKSGVENGDYEYVGYCLCHLEQHLILIGEFLERVEQNQASYINSLCKINQEQTITFISINHQMVLNLQGKSTNKCELIGTRFDESTMVPYFQTANLRAALALFYFAKLMLFYLFKNYSQAVKNAEAAQEYALTVMGKINFITYNFYYSLSLLAQYPNASCTVQNQYLSQIEENQQKMHKWAYHAPFNYQHKYELVEAEKARILGDTLKAQEYYDRAINGAKDNGYIQDEALANELAAEFYLASGREKIAKAYMTDAYYGYIRWGAEAKVKDLDERYPHLIFRSSKQETTDIEATRIIHSTRSTNSTATGLAVLDLVSVMKAAQALSGEIVLDELLRKLMTILLENAGASKGCLLLQRQGTPVIEVSATGVEREAVVVQSVTPTSELLPLSLIYYVMRSLENIVLNNAAGDSNFASDFYIQLHKPKSVVCFPILNQGKLVGILYLENNLTTGAFTKERIEILRVLCFQAAISLENAFLYSNLEQANQQLEVTNQRLADYSHTLEAKVEARTQELRGKNKQLQQTVEELKAAQKQIIAQEKLASLGALTAGVAHEIRNPLNFVTSLATLSEELTNELVEEIERQFQRLEKESIEAISEILNYLKRNVLEINQQGQRANSIIQSMLMHARTDGSSREKTNLNALVSQAVQLAYHSIRAKDDTFNVTFETSYDDSIKELEVAFSDLNRAFINIIDNACYATQIKQKKMGSSFIPSISVLTKNRDNAVEIRIRDNGIGIPPEIQDKIFHPFFTTKPPGQGTGLGLSLTHDIIVGQHRGHLELQTEPEIYTEFIISLPKDKTE